MRPFTLLLLLAGLGIAGWQHFSTQPPPPPDSHFPSAEAPVSSAARNSDQLLASALQRHQSKLQIEGQGTVRRILPDDNSGTRHQRFILTLKSGQSLLVAHNIDLAPRIDALKVGDPVAFFGEYEWSSKGGVIHWTHHDPAGRHPDGWIRHGGQTYR